MTKTVLYFQECDFHGRGACDGPCRVVIIFSILNLFQSLFCVGDVSRAHLAHTDLEFLLTAFLLKTLTLIRKQINHSKDN
eukprot:4172329-Amphidinium_carterae.1